MGLVDFEAVTFSHGIVSQETADQSIAVTSLCGKTVEYQLSC